MTRFISTFISGFDEIIKQQLIDFEVKKLLDGLVVYETNGNTNNISNLRFINNSFIFLASTGYKKETDNDEVVETLFNKCDLGRLINDKIVERAKSIRVIVTKENQPVAINKRLRRDIENTISHVLGVKINSVNPDTEFWVIIRRENIAFLGFRITDIGIKRYKPEKGELKPQLSNLLCLISEPKKTDVVLDPFAGSGAIILERTRHFPYKKAYANEIDKKRFSQLKRQFTKNKGKVEVSNQNALDIEIIKSDSIDKIITDPPWGLFNEKNKDYFPFYKKMLEEFARVLKLNGIAVILTAKKEEFRKALQDTPDFKLNNEYNVLVSGKKAGVYKLILRVQKSKSNKKLIQSGENK